MKGTGTIRGMKMENRIFKYSIHLLVAWTMVFGLALPVSAARVNDIYRATVPVDNQSAASRKSGIRQGLAQVLVKVSGSSRVLQNPAMAEELNRADAYVLELGYTSLAPSGGERQMALAVRYSQQQVNRLFRREAIQIWPAVRPDLLVWLVSDTPTEGVQYLDEEMFPQPNQRLAYHLDRRGAAFIRPALDIEDRRLAPADAVWQFDTSRLNNVAKRYGVKQWLVIRCYQNSVGQWRGASFLNTGGKTDLQQLSGKDMDQLLAVAVDRAIDRLAADYVFIPQQNSDALILTLENIPSFDAYSRAVDYLASLELVREVQVLAVKGDRLRLSLSMDGDADILLAALHRDRRLREVDAPIADAAPDVVSQEYHFRWEF